MLISSFKRFNDEISRHTLVKVLAAVMMCLSSVLAFDVLAQDMTPGFAMLEEGKFKQAKNFFGEILKTDSANQTALICYGRATGLSGNVPEAQSVFNKLLKVKPGSEEVLLNLAESYLWDSKGAPAADIYAEILEGNPESFAALLGYANSMSMQKKYFKAYEYIKKALEVQPTNGQAKISRKFIRLGLADFLASQKADYDQALEIVNENLKDDPQDQNSLMLKATIYLLSEDFEAAQKIYTDQIQNTLDKYIGWSVTAHLLKNDKQAIKIVDEGLATITNDKSGILKMKLQYVNALLWNGKLKEAENYLSELQKEYPNNAELLAAKAQVLIYMSDYEGGLDHYHRFLETDSTSFSGNLGSADAHHALGMDNLAYEGAFRTLIFFPGQKDVIGFINRLNATHAPGIETSVTLSETSDDSWRRKIAGEARVGLSALSHISAGYATEVFGDATDQDEIQVNSAIIGGGYRFNRRLRLDARLELAKASGGATEQNYVNHLVQATLRVSKSQQLILAQQKELQNFNRNLLAQNISMDHFILKNISFWKLAKIGWYTEFYHTQFSDGNARNLLFTSVYRNVTDQPLLKTGFNYSTMSFEESKPLEYYSPESFHNFEWFAGFNINQSKSFPLTIMADFAVGYQMSDGDQIVAWRAQLKLQKEIGRLKIAGHAQHNSLSAVANNGFSFSQAGFSATYRLSQKPIFYKKYSNKN